MRIVKAVLVSRHTADGTSFVYETVPLGKEYFVNLNSLQRVAYFNTKAKTTIMRDVVMAVDEQGSSQGLLPTELLAIDIEGLNIGVIQPRPAVKPEA